MIIIGVGNQECLYFNYGYCKQLKEAMGSFLFGLLGDGRAALGRLNQGVTPCPNSLVSVYWPCSQGTRDS